MGVLMTKRVKVSSKHQIVVPADVRHQLNIESGDYLTVEVQDGRIILIPEPRNWTAYLRGLHKEVWEGIDVDEYLRQERESWRDHDIWER
jgi:AbrB family looped-hinge helix DNA binding protein